MTMINLLPWREQLREQRKRNFIIALSATAVTSLLIVLISHMTVGSWISHQQRRNDMLSEQITRYNQRIVRIKELNKVRDALIARMEIIQKLQENRPQIIHLFDSLVRVMPKGVYLTQIKRQGERVTVFGYAESNTNISDLMRKIEASEKLQRPVLSEIKEEIVAGKVYNKFNLDLVLST